MGLKEFIMSVNYQATVVDPEPPPPVLPVPAIAAVHRTVSNKYVDITFDMGVYRDNGRVNPLQAANFSIVDFVAGGTTAIAIAAVKMNTHYTSGTALALIGGEYTVRVFITLTGTPTSVESFKIQCTDVFGPEGGKAISLTTETIKLNITPLLLWDYLETASVTTTGLGIATLADVMGVANFTQTTDAQRPIDGGDFVGFRRATPKWMTAGDVGSLDFQKGNSFTVVLKRINVTNSATTGWIISNRANDPGNNGWSVSVGTDGSLFFVMHDGTLQGFCDVDSFSGSGERTIFCVNNNGTMNVYDDAGNTLGTTGNATGIGTISYTSVSAFLGRRGNNTASYLDGTVEKIAIVNKAMSADERADFVENMNP